MQKNIHRKEFFIEVENIDLFKNKILAQSKVFDDFIFLDSNCDYNNKSDYDFVAAFYAKEKFEGESFDKLQEFYEQKNDYLFGNFCYDLKDEIFRLKSNHNQTVPFPKIGFFVPHVIVFSVNRKVKLSLSNEFGIEEFNLLFEKEVFESKTKFSIHEEIQKLNWEEYERKFIKIKRHIHRGDIYEVNLCNQVLGKKEIEPIDTFKKLNSLSSAPYAALYKHNYSWLISSSPELYLKRKGETIVTKPIKGTAPRNFKFETDEQNKKLLLQSEKERNENVMIVDLARNDLSTIAERNSVIVSKIFDIESYKQVHQMVSTIECKVSNTINSVNIIQNTFPMASMTGVPKKKALEIIEEIEEFNRGLYSGSIGFFDPNGNFTFNVVIRSILYNQETSAISFAVGSAITDKCNASDEFRECLLKAKAMLEVLGL
jgi:para-aminobenzoate synthetase component I